jgi:DNA-binding NarL/FixJ family response regulator
VDRYSEAIEFVQRHSVDLVITEIRLVEGNGIALVRQLREINRDIKTIVLTTRDDWLYCERALSAGAQGFLGKSRDIDQIVDCIKDVVAGKIVVDENIQQDLFSMLSPGDGSNPAGGISQLTLRELQILELIGLGMTTREIAEQLDLSVKTIDSYRDKLKQKLNLKSSGKLNRFAFEWSFLNS